MQTSASLRDPSANDAANGVELVHAPTLKCRGWLGSGGRTNDRRRVRHPGTSGVAANAVPRNRYRAVLASGKPHSPGMSGDHSGSGVPFEPSRSRATAAAIPSVSLSVDPLGGAQPVAESGPISGDALTSKVRPQASHTLG